MSNKSLKRFLPEIILLAFLTLVFFLRSPFIDFHFFWDEAWVYGPAIKFIVNNGFGITPEVLPESISRGHPVLFHLAYAFIPALLNNDSVYVIHLIGLLINISLLIGFFYSIKLLSNSWVALLGTILLAIHSVILAQLSLVLPELFLGITIFCGITFFSLGRMKMFAFFTAISLLIKESALILPISIILFSIFDCLVDKQKNSHSIKRNLKYLGISFLPVFIFFLIQYIQRGYVFFPEHIGMIKISYKYFRDNFELIYNFLFEDQGRFILGLSIFLIICFFSGSNWKKGILIFLIGFTIMKIIFRAWSISVIGNLIVLPILFFAIYYLAIYTPLKHSKSKSSRIFLNISVIFIILFTIFSSVNFFTLRYTVPLIIVFIGFSIIWINKEFKYSHFTLFILPLFLIPLGYYNLYPSKAKLGDTEVFYSDALHVQSELYAYLLENNLEDKSFYGNFTNKAALNIHEAGLVLKGRELKKIGKSNLKTRDYIIHSNYDEAINLDTVTFDFDTLESFEHKKARIDLLEIKSPQP